MGSVSRRFVALLVCVAVTMILSPAARAQNDGPKTTLGRIQESGRITLGVRESALPFSYKLPNGSHTGYSIALCQEIIEDISKTLGGRPLDIFYRTVTAESRIGMVRSGDVDLECGTTTRNAQRQTLVSFSPTFFVAGTKLLVSRQSQIRSFRDLAGKTVVVTAGTTGEAAIQVLVDRLLLRIKIVAAPENAQAFSALLAGKADAFATDDVVLAGMAATRAGADFHVVGDYLSYEPYGLMFRKDDPAFAEVVENTFRRLASSRRLAELYDRWLLQPLPGGEVLNMPISAELAEVFRVLGQPD